VKLVHLVGFITKKFITHSYLTLDCPPLSIAGFENE